MGRHGVMLVPLAALAAASTCSQLEQGEAEGVMPALAVPDLDLAVLGGLGETWRELPEVAERARVATHAASGAAAAARAWGDPGAGCFVVMVQVPGGDAALHRALGNALAGGEAGGGEAGQAGGDGRLVSDIAVAAGALRGRVRAISAAPAPGMSATLATACFYSPREPALCAGMCERLLQSIEIPFIVAPPGEAASVEMAP